MKRFVSFLLVLAFFINGLRCLATDVEFCSEDCHAFDNECDEQCNICGYMREVPHSFASECSIKCELCGIERNVTHEFDNPCDRICNKCGFVRNTAHSYDNECDGECNVCGQKRSTVHKVKYYNDGSERYHYEKCIRCGVVTENHSLHIYSSPLSEKCEICGHIRKIYRFFDLDFNDKKYYDISFLSSIGVFTGYKDGRFGGKDNITRQDFIVALTRLEQINLSGFSKLKCFSDVKQNKYYTSALNWAKTIGVANGYDGKNFGVNDYLTFEQMSVFLYRYYGDNETVEQSKVTEYKNYEKVSSYATNSVIWVVENNVFEVKDSEICPNNCISRSEIVSVFIKILKNK